MAGMSNATRHALTVIRTYLSGPNEAVQYCFEHMADLVTETSSGIMGGIQAGVVPPNNVVADHTATVFALGSTPPGSPAGSLALNVVTGELVASWTVSGSAITVSGRVRCVETLATPANRFLFVVPAPVSGFYVLATTNI